MPCRDTCPVGQAALGTNAVFESSSPNKPVLLLPIIPVSPCKHRGEMSDESQPRAHADRQEGRERRDGKKRERTEKENRKAAREEEEYKIG